MRRASRLVPLLLGNDDIVVVLAKIAPKVFNTAGVTIGDFVKSLLFIPYIKESGAVRPILFVGWSLNCEVAFYTMFFVSLLFNWKQRTTVASIFVVLFWFLTVKLQAVNPVLALYAQTLFLAFAMGMAAERIYRALMNPNSTGGSVRVAFIWGAAIASLYAAVYFQTWHTSDRPWTISFGIAIALFALFLAADGLVSRSQKWSQVAVRLGNTTYGVYLIHPAITSPLSHR